MLKTLIIAGSLALSGAAFAQTQQNQGPDSAVQAAPRTSTTTTAPGTMQDRDVRMPTNNSTGNMNTKGAGKGTTGTGGPGGSGNE
jgi:hypothetical protein